MALRPSAAKAAARAARIRSSTDWGAVRTVGRARGPAGADHQLPRPDRLRGQLRQRQVRNNGSSAWAQVDAADFGLSGMTLHKRITLPSVSFGKLDVQNVKTNLIPSDDEDDWWVIGSALMNQFVTVIDYHSQQFIIKPYSDLSFQSRYNLAGLDLRKLQNGHLLVKYVFPKMPAEDAGIKAGDVITSINQVNTSTMSEDDWIALNAQANQFDICVENQSCVNLTTTQIKGYSDH